MHTQQILLNGISVDELVARLKSELIPTAPIAPKDSQENYLTSKEVKELLQVSLVTLASWRKLKKIPFHRFGSRIRYRRDEILNIQKFSNGKK